MDNGENESTFLPRRQPAACWSPRQPAVTSAPPLALARDLREQTRGAEQTRGSRPASRKGRGAHPKSAFALCFKPEKRKARPRRLGARCHVLLADTSPGKCFKPCKGASRFPPARWLRRIIEAQTSRGSPCSPTSRSARAVSRRPGRRAGGANGLFLLNRSGIPGAGDRPVGLWRNKEQDLVGGGTISSRT